MAIDKLPIPVQFDPTYNEPLDSRDKMYDSLVDLNLAIESKRIYPGQITKVRNGNDRATLYIITDDLIPKKLMTSSNDTSGATLDLNEIINAIIWHIY